MLKKTLTGYETVDGVSEEQEKLGVLKPVFKDGKLLNETTFDEIRNRARS